MTKKYKIGDVVKLRKDLIHGENYGGYMFLYNMRPMIEYSLKIINVGSCYTVEYVDLGYESSYHITDEMIDYKISDGEKQKNYAPENKIENFVYEKGRRKVKKYNSKMELEDSYSFTLQTLNEKVIYSNNAVIVILGDGSKGVAKCMDEDTFDRVKGLKIAYNRARIKSLQKELNDLTK